ncbi:hypothetical protein OF83DRAFT_306019 [Amylostereum chailletii]|nr:hypothetical protein OF83DRAFT_306019 [Amylostereum chailletii]
MLSAQLDGLQVSAASLAAYRTVSPSSRDMDRGKDDAGDISSASPDINSDRTPASTHLADYTVSTQPARSVIPREKKPVGKIGQKDGDAKTPPGKGKRRSSASIKQRVRFDVVVPDIIAHGLVMEDDVEELFEIFYTRINPFVGILDPLLHTPSSLFSRSPCLFNVVCAISIRYSKKANVHSIAMHIAKTAAANTLIDGFKSVELCQAHVLMSMYSEGEDHGWIDAWLALQIAADLKLQQPLALDATSACHEREAINRTRTWRVCRNLDRSMSMFYGKPSANGEDITSHDDPQWYDQSSTNTFESDIRTAALSSLLRILTDFHAEVYEEQVSPQRSKKDMRSLVLQYDKSVVQCHVEWEGRLDDNFDTKVPGAIVRTKLLSLYTNYARLVMFSSALQHGLKHGLQETDRVVFEKGVDAANAVVVILVDVLAKTGYLRYSPNGAVHASALRSMDWGSRHSRALLFRRVRVRVPPKGAHFVEVSRGNCLTCHRPSQLLQPQCAPLVHEGLRTAIRDTVDRVVNTFGSPLVAVDARHPPKLYSDFLRTLLAKRRRESGRVRDAQPSPPRPLTLPDSSEPESPTRSRSSHGTGSLSEPPDREAVQAHGTPRQARMEKTRGQAVVSTPRTPLRLGSGFDFSFNISIA